MWEEGRRGWGNGTKESSLGRSWRISIVITSFVPCCIEKKIKKIHTTLELQIYVIVWYYHSD